MANTLGAPVPDTAATPVLLTGVDSTNVLRHVQVDAAGKLQVAGISGGGGGGSGDASAANQVTGNASLASIDADIGNVADAAYSGTGNSTVIGALKAIANRALGVLKSSNTNQVTPQVISTTAALLNAVNAETRWSLQGGASYLVSLTQPGGATTNFAGTAAVETSVDGGSTWATATLSPIALPSAAITTVTAVGLWRVRAPEADAVLMRLRLTALTSGSALASIAPDTPTTSVLMPWTYSLLVNNIVVAPFDATGIADLSVQIAAMSGGTYQIQGTNDASIAGANWTAINIWTGAVSSAVISGPGVFVARLNAYRFVRMICTGNVTSVNIAGIKANYGFTGNVVQLDGGTLQVIGQRVQRRAAAPFVLSAATRNAGTMLLSSTGAMLSVSSAAIGSGANSTITGMQLVSSNGAAATKAQFSVWAFLSATPPGLTLTDNTAFAPAAAVAAGGVYLGVLGGLIPNMGSNAYGYAQTGINTAVTAGGGGTTWILLVLNNGYTSAAGETISLTLSTQE